VEHKDWVSQVRLPNEPIPAYDLKCNAALSIFINQFQDYMRMFRARRAWEQGKTQSLSMADRMMFAKEETEKSNQNRAIQKVQIAKAAPPKPKKNKRMEI